MEETPSGSSEVLKLGMVEIGKVLTLRQYPSSCEDKITTDKCSAEHFALSKLDLIRLLVARWLYSRIFFC